MKITGIGPFRASDIKKKKGASAGEAAEFSALLSGADDTQAPSSTGHVSISQAIIGIQEVDWEEQSRKENTQRGHQLLDMLEAVRTGLLIGRISLQQLHSLQQTMAKKKSTVNDPRLAAIIQEIEVRAAVELAKLEKLHY